MSLKVYRSGHGKMFIKPIIDIIARRSGILIGGGDRNV